MEEERKEWTRKTREELTLYTHGQAIELLSLLVTCLPSPKRIPMTRIPANAFQACYCDLGPVRCEARAQ